MQRQIVLKKLDKPREQDLGEDIDWVVDSFGWSSGRDIESTTTKIVEDLLKRFAEQVRVNAQLIARDLDLNSSIVNYHVRNLMDSGVLYRKGRKIYLRGGSLKGAVQEMRKDADRIFDEIEEIAEEIDDVLGFPNRR